MKIDLDNGSIDINNEFNKILIQSEKEGPYLTISTYKVSEEKLTAYRGTPPPTADVCPVSAPSPVWKGPCSLRQE